MARIKLNTARNCLRYLIKAYDITKICIPYYVCPVIPQIARAEGCEVQFYHVDKNFMPACEFSDEDYILYPNYFGVCEGSVKQLAETYPRLIVDNAHFYTERRCGLASFTSLRKIFPKLRNGAVLHIEKPLSLTLEQDKTTYEYQSLDFEQFTKNELFLDTEPLKLMSKVTEEYFEQIDFQKDKRVEVFKHLHGLLGDRNELELDIPREGIPFVYPYLNHNDDLGFKLEKMDVDIYRYWKRLPKTYLEQDFYEYLVPIPLDEQTLRKVGMT